MYEENCVKKADEHMVFDILLNIWDCQNTHLSWIVTSSLNAHLYSDNRIQYTHMYIVYIIQNNNYCLYNMFSIKSLRLCSYLIEPNTKRVFMVYFSPHFLFFFSQYVPFHSNWISLNSLKTGIVKSGWMCCKLCKFGFSVKYKKKLNFRNFGDLQ